MEGEVILIKNNGKTQNSKINIRITISTTA